MLSACSTWDVTLFYTTSIEEVAYNDKQITLGVDHLGWGVNVLENIRLKCIVIILRRCVVYVKVTLGAHYYLSQRWEGY